MIPTWQQPISAAVLVVWATVLIIMAWTSPKTSAFVLHHQQQQPKPTHVALGKTLQFHRCQEKTTVALSMSIPNPLDTLTSGLASIVRLPAGVTVVDPTAAAAAAAAAAIQIKELYDVENNLACRKVRERITELDLVVQKLIPAAPNSRVFTDKTYPYSLPAGSTIPRLVVQVNGPEQQQQQQQQPRVLLGDEAILAFLDETFPALSKPSTDARDTTPSFVDQLWPALRTAGGYIAGALRLGRGTTVSRAAFGAPRPVQPLILYSYEGNQFCRLVREVLHELDLVYELKSAGKESPRRIELAALAPGGSSQCPFLIDPNTQQAMAESADIIAYLYKTYALWTPPNEILQWASNVILPPVKPVFAKLTMLQAGGGAASGEEDGDAGGGMDAASRMSQAKRQIQDAITSNPVVVYTYGLSPFSSETKALLDRLQVDYKEYSLGAEWFPGLLAEPQTRAALLEMTGQSSLPHIFVGGKSIGGLFSGTPGLVPALEQGIFLEMVAQAKKTQTTITPATQ